MLHHRTGRYAGHFAFLRKHPPPDAKKLKEFVQWCREMGFVTPDAPLEIGSDRNSSQLQASIEALKQGLSATDAELVEFKVCTPRRVCLVVVCASSCVHCVLSMCVC